MYGGTVGEQLYDTDPSTSPLADIVLKEGW